MYDSRFIYIYMYYLTGHNFSIDATYVDSSIKTGLVVRINNVAAKGFVRTNATIVWPLIIRED